MVDAERARYESQRHSANAVPVRILVALRSQHGLFGVNTHLCWVSASTGNLCTVGDSSINCNRKVLC